MFKNSPSVCYIFFAIVNVIVTSVNTYTYWWELALKISTWSNLYEKIRTSEPRAAHFRPAFKIHTRATLDPVVDRVERTDRLSCFVDRLDRLHRLVDNFTTRLDLDDFRSTWSTWSTCGHVDHSFLLVLAYCMATDVKKICVQAPDAFPVPSGRPTGLAFLFSFHPLIFS